MVALPPGGSYTSRLENDKFLKSGGTQMKWEKPSYNDLRFGFEVTMYIYNR